MNESKINVTYSISLHFDKESENYLSSLIKEIAEITTSYYFLNKEIPPHITIGMFRGFKENLEEDIQKFISLIKKEINCFSPFNITISHFDTLKDKVVFASLIAASITQLKEMNKKYYSLLKDNYTTASNNLYIPSLFYPHITLATGLSKSEIIKALEVCEKYIGEKILTISNIKIAIKTPYKVFYESGKGSKNIN